MSAPELSPSHLGERTTRIFYPPYSSENFDVIRDLLDNAVMYGIAATRLIHEDRITGTIYGATK